MANREYHNLYKRKAWEGLRQATLARDMWRCQRCGVYLVTGRTSPQAAVVNHKTPHKGDLGLFFDPDNLEAVCKRCHDSDIQSEERSGRLTIGADGWPTVERQPYSIPHGTRHSGIPVTIISGAPGSGKTTYAQSMADPDDLIIDMDLIAVDLGLPMYGGDWSERRKAFRRRDALIKSLANRRKGKAFLIVTAPTRDERRAWRKALGPMAAVHVMPTSKDECIRRVKADARRADVADRQCMAIERWFNATPNPQLGE